MCVCACNCAYMLATHTRLSLSLCVRWSVVSDSVSFFLHTLTLCVRHACMCLFVCCEHIMAVCVDIKVQLCVLYLAGVIFSARRHTHSDSEKESVRGKKRDENRSGHHGYVSMARHKQCQKKKEELNNNMIYAHSVRIMPMLL